MNVYDISLISDGHTICIFVGQINQTFPGVKSCYVSF